MCAANEQLILFARRNSSGGRRLAAPRPRRACGRDLRARRRASPTSQARRSGIIFHSAFQRPGAAGPDSRGRAARRQSASARRPGPRAHLHKKLPGRAAPSGREKWSSRRRRRRRRRRRLFSRFARLPARPPARSLAACTTSDAAETSPAIIHVAGPAFSGPAGRARDPAKAEPRSLASACQSHSSGRHFAPFNALRLAAGQPDGPPLPILAPVYQSSGSRVTSLARRRPGRLAISSAEPRALARRNQSISWLRAGAFPLAARRETTASPARCRSPSLGGEARVPRAGNRAAAC